MKKILIIFTVCMSSVCFSQNCTMTVNNSNYAVCLNRDQPLDISVTSTAVQFQWQKEQSPNVWLDEPLANSSNFSVAPSNFTTISTHQYRCISFESGTPCDTSLEITISVLENLTPTVSVASSDSNNSICSGNSVTFTATPNNGGSNPAYQWKVNGVNAGTNASSFITTTLTNNAQVSVVMTSNNACQTTAMATSNSIITAVISNVTPGVSITSSDLDNSICAGNSVTFTATPNNGGSNPAFQWKVNGVNAGTNASSFITTALTNNAQVSVVMTANNVCQTSPTSTSNSITTAVISNVTPVVSITSSDLDNSICAGNSVNFTATPNNGGSNPSYQWKVNGVNAGTNASSFITTTLTNNAQVSVIMTANNVCQTSPTSTSNSITTAVISNVTPVVSITSSDLDNSICAGNSVNFTATPNNGGSNPSYQWKVNGVNAGINANTFVTTSLNNNDIVTVVMTANNVCQLSSIATSNPINTSVIAYVVPSVIISSNDADNSICAGTSVIFTATPINGGPTPTFQWKLNGMNVGTNSSQYQNSSLSNGSILSCVMTANNACQTASSATSLNVNMTVIDYVIPFVSVSSNDNDNTICQGVPVVFSAVPTNGGASPAYQWKLNGVNVGTNNASYSNSTLSQGDVVSVVMTANNVCQTVTQPISVPITMTVYTRPNFGTIPLMSICSGSSLQFDPSASVGSIIPAGTTYTWSASTVAALNESSNLTPVQGPISFNELNNISNSDQTVTYTLSGVSNGCVSNSPGILSVVVTPVIAQVSNSQSICAGESVELFAFGGQEYQWMESGELSNTVNFPYLASPTAFPSASTQYDIKIINAQGCYTIRSLTLNVNPRPEVFILSENWSICSGQSTDVFITTSLAESDIHWQAFPQGNLFNTALTGQGNSITQSWENNGLVPQNVIYRVYAEKNGCYSDTTEAWLQVKPNPVLNGVLSGETCSEQEYTYLPQGWIPNTLYTWTRLSAPSGWISVSPSSGLGEVNQYFTDVSEASMVQYLIEGELNGCSSADTLNLWVYPLPHSLVQNIFAFCPEDSPQITLSDWVNLGYSVSWLSESLFSPNNSAQTHYLGDSSIQTAVLAQDQNGCSRQEMVVIDFLEAPNAYFIGSNTVCEGSSSLFQAVDPNINVYQWTLDNILVSENGNFNFESPIGEYTLNLSVEDDNGCGAQFSQSIEVNALPVGHIYGETSFCQGASEVMFSTNPTTSNIDWEVLNATILGGQGTSHLYLNLGAGISSSIILTIQNELGCQFSDTLEVNLNEGTADSPIQLEQLGISTLLHPDGAFNHYDWGKTNINNGIETSQLMNVQYYNYGNLQLDQYYYWVETTNSDGCVTRSYFNWPNYANEIGNTEEAHEVWAYPNPASDILNLGNRADVVELYSNDGRRVLMDFNISVIDVTSFPHGVYLLKTTIDDQIKMQTIIK